jgi:tyrosine-protein phosphatase
MEPLSFARRLRKKISAPSIREQEQLQSLQAKIKASLPLRRAAANLSTVDEALTSPRATEFTRNPFALTVQTDHRPHDPLRPRTSDGSDPRSPAFTGANPITRNIYDVL